MKDSPSTGVRLASFQLNRNEFKSQVGVVSLGAGFTDLIGWSRAAWWRRHSSNRLLHARRGRQAWAPPDNGAWQILFPGRLRKYRPGAAAGCTQDVCQRLS